ncbi:TetR/AcrR family transcriptional regulator [Actinoplanes sp. M2I2]|uniref:TetR/AcrR family transcriptional regulator n=1 Tax=Actinoplanes sp. M2I2 TaxID=1734444 RepID=UPI0020218435|nr:TetR/AcrR family transcriptional regulator [Actinoplanes sp. M2I2]
MPRPPSIDRDAILRAALDIADRGGVAAVTMQAVAEALTVTPMALYRHVDGKEAMLDGIVELLLDELMAEAGGSSSPTVLGQVLAAARHVAGRHPEAFLLLLGRPAATDAARLVRGRFHDILEAAGVPGERVAVLERILSTTILGMAAGHATARFAAHDQDDDLAVTLAFLEAGLERFRTP